MKHLKSYNESIEPSYISINSSNYDECVETIPKRIDKDGKAILQVLVDKDDNGEPTYKKLLDRLGLEEISGSRKHSDEKPWYYVEVTFK